MAVTSQMIERAVRNRPEATLARFVDVHGTRELVFMAAQAIRVRPNGAGIGRALVKVIRDFDTFNLHEVMEKHNARHPGRLYRVWTSTGVVVIARAKRAVDAARVVTRSLKRQFGGGHATKATGEQDRWAEKH